MANKPQPLSMDLILAGKGGAVGVAPDQIVGSPDQKAAQARAGEGGPGRPAPAVQQSASEDAPWTRTAPESGRKVPLNVRVPEDVRDGLARLVFATKTNNEVVVAWALRRVLQEWAAAHGVEDWRNVPI
jgi:hypothetical protein